MSINYNYDKMRSHLTQMQNHWENPWKLARPGRESNLWVRQGCRREKKDIFILTERRMSREDGVTQERPSPQQ